MTKNTPVVTITFLKVVFVVSFTTNLNDRVIRIVIFSLSLFSLFLFYENSVCTWWIGVSIARISL